MEKDIRILLVDDHQVVREGLRHMLAREEDMVVVGQSANSEETMSQLEILSPNVVLMDIKMPGVDGIELTRQVKQKYPSCNVIMLTLYDEYLTQAIEFGATGYLLKDIKREELTQAIRQVHQGKVVVSESITAKARNKERLDKNAKESNDNMVEEVQLVLSPPIEANHLIRFASRLEETLQSHMLQVIGSWQEGTAIIITLTKATLLADILNKLTQIDEIKAVEEKLPTIETDSALFKKATAIPRQRYKPSKTIFITLEKDQIDKIKKQTLVFQQDTISLHFN